MTVIRELFGVMVAEGAAGGYIVTGGDFTPEAKAFAEGRNLKLVDGKKLHGLLQQARGTRAAATPVTRAPKPAESRVMNPTTTSTVPACPSCESPMVQRTAKKGQNAGSQFWGCSRYPACRGTR